MTKSRPRHATRRDANQREIVDELRAAGFVVLDLADVGGECPDLFVCGWHTGFGCAAWLGVEVKSAGGRMTEAQQKFLTELVNRFGDMPVVIAFCTEDVLEWFSRPR